MDKPMDKPKNRSDERDNDFFDNTIEGKNAVLEALKSGRKIDKVYIARSREGESYPGHIAALAREKGAVVVDCDRKKLDFMSRTRGHQGVIAIGAAKEYAEVSDILNLARERNEPPFVVICDHLSDPYNLGAIIRSAEVAGAHGVIIPNRRSVGLTPAVSKASAGAIEHLPVARVANIPSLLEELKKEGLWLFAADGEGDTLVYDADLTVPCAIVIGSEGEGVGRLVLSRCDYRIRIPVKGRVNSLNASAAAAVILFETLRQRITKAK